VGTRPRRRCRLPGPEHEKERQNADEGQNESADEAYIEYRCGVLLKPPPPDSAPESPPATVMTAEVVDGENGSSGSLDHASSVGAINVRAAAGGTGHGTQTMSAGAKQDLDSP
jgi:hypothetical protein